MSASPDIISVVSVWCWVHQIDARLASESTPEGRWVRRVGYVADVVADYTPIVGTTIKTVIAQIVSPHPPDL
jgi:hypothetical protein